MPNLPCPHEIRTLLMLFYSLVVGGGSPLWGASPTVPEDHAARMRVGLDLFQRDVRGILERNCLECHHGASAKGNFDLSTYEALRDSGFVGETSSDSHLLAVVRHESEPHMPWKREKLDAATIAKIAQWIDMGAPYDRPLGGGTDGGALGSGKPPIDRQFWSFLPLGIGGVPPLQAGGVASTIVDRFVEARLGPTGLTLGAAAEQRVLARRVYLDLLGVPPTGNELNSFLTHRAPDAYERLVDRLLADPRYGERWSRHWLDVARFAESDGFEHDTDRIHAFHYRDFVIRALNEDLPYSDFVRWQVAGDEFAPENPLALAATGFLIAGVFPTQITEAEFERTRYDQLDDMISTYGVAFLGMTVGCARCHDHKYDPISSEDYYALAAIFTTTIPAIVDAEWERRGLPNPPGPADAAGRLWIATEGLPPVVNHANGRGYPHIYAPTYYLRRGDPDQKDHVAQPSFLKALMAQDMTTANWHEPVPANGRTTYQRRALANWMLDHQSGAGALVARVIVNRLWQHHLGRGLVGTPNDFGLQGERPSNPDLLDRLAAELIRNRWHLKPIHRLILTSRTYRQSSAIRPAAAAVDPDNQLFWRFPYHRLEAEPLRDCMLAVSGGLDPTMYGPGTLDPTSRRRSIYFTVKRSHAMGSMQLFDMPEPLVSIGARSRTTIAPQALMMLNDQNVRTLAEELARSILAVTRDTNDVIDQAYLRVLGRLPHDSERRRHRESLDPTSPSAPAGPPDADPQRVRITDLCQLLLCLNEFAYVE